MESLRSVDEYLQDRIMSCYVHLPSVHRPLTIAIHIYEFHNTFKMTNFPKVARAGSVVPSLRGVAPGPTCASQVPMVESPSTRRCTLCPPRGQGRVAGADYPPPVALMMLPSPLDEAWERDRSSPEPVLSPELELVLDAESSSSPVISTTDFAFSFLGGVPKTLFAPSSIWTFLWRS